jgi:cytoplasmic iron level regulating protein YaaA (DUF328/UPF0246 family)
MLILLSPAKTLDFTIEPQTGKYTLPEFAVEAQNLSPADLDFAQSHLRILSGLYGVLRPLDLIQPYRLEMGTRLKTTKGVDLYEFWGNKITKSVKKTIVESGGNLLINLASNEYFKSLDAKKLGAEIITPMFKDFHNGQYRFLTIYGKRARGMMTRFIIRHQISNAEDIKSFEEDGYIFNPVLSRGNEWVFTRG